MNAEIARKVAAYIRENPSEYNQSTYGEETEQCSIGCIAFHAAREAGTLPPLRTADHGLFAGPDVALAGRAALGLTEDEAAGLFDACGDGWPFELQRRLRAGDRAQRARVAAELLEGLADGRLSLLPTCEDCDNRHAPAMSCDDAWDLIRRSADDMEEPEA